MVFELQRIRAVCGCGPLVSLPYWLCQPACYHTHTHRGGIARKAKKKMNERTHNIFKQPRVGTTASRTRAHWKWRSPSWPGWLLEPRQAPTKPPFCWHAEEKHTLIHTRHQYQHRSSGGGGGGAENPCEPRSSGGGEQKQPETKPNRAAYALTIHGKEGNSLAELPQYMGRLVLRRSLPSSCSSHSLRDAMLQAYDVRLPHP